MTTERERLAAAREGVSWKKWGPYLSERQWGTVREDYSEDGDAWDYFTHDQARSRAYRWGEDGLAGICDDQQRLCFALALWNGKDPILKERLFGLTNSEGNHGEDVKEYYFYLDSTPTHSYMKYLYKYPQAAFPYDELVEENRPRKATTWNTSCSIPVSSTKTATSMFLWSTRRRGPRTLHQITVATGAGSGHLARVAHALVPQPGHPGRRACSKPVLEGNRQPGECHLRASYRPAVSRVARRLQYCEGGPPLLFTENETNNANGIRRQQPSPYTKDGINDFWSTATLRR